VGATGQSDCAARWSALGSSAEIRVCAPAALAQTRSEVESVIAAIDRACSRFRPDSELSRVNAAAGRRVRVSALFLAALGAALRAAALSAGDLDPTIGNALARAGYDRDFALIEGQITRSEEVARRLSSERAPALARLRVRPQTSWSAIEVDRSDCSVRLPPGVALDLGAIAKAFAADLAAAAAHRATGVGVLVSLGGDIATAGEAPSEGWLVRVTDNHRAGMQAPGQTIRLRGGGLATSSKVARAWRAGGATLHHIIDPRTLAPARGPLRTVSVAAANATDANIAATAALIRGGRAAHWLATFSLPARLVAIDGTVRVLAGWPPEHEGIGQWR
jgi:thiamine biosynthesis lipoprotein